MEAEGCFLYTLSFTLFEICDVILLPFFDLHLRGIFLLHIYSSIN